MNKFLQVVASLVFASTAFAGPCDEVLIPYATDSVINFCLKKYDSTNVDDNEKMALKVDATFAAAEVKLQTDTAGEANIGTLPTDRGSCYSQPISTAESTGKRVYITYIDATDPQVWIAHCIIGYTFNHASAHIGVIDLNTAYSELASLPSNTAPTIAQMIQWSYQMMRNKLTATATQQKLYKADESTVLGTSTLADDGTTFTRGESQ